MPMFNYSKLDPSECDFVDIAPVEDLPVGERLFVEIDRTPIVIFNIAGVLFAIADLCSHDDGPLGDGELIGSEVTCPRHGASFDVRSGAALSLPAIVDIPAYPVRIVEGRIQVGLPK
jgi:3-phenylpropionate/trans-cinnamate dioxygenase ferredoxin component